MIPFEILWLEWEERNDKVFKGESTAIDDLFPRVLLRVAKWASLRKEFYNLRLDDILHNWGLPFFAMTPLRIGVLLDGFL